MFTRIIHAHVLERSPPTCLKTQEEKKGVMLCRSKAAERLQAVLEFRCFPNYSLHYAVVTLMLYLGFCLMSVQEFFLSDLCCAGSSGTEGE